MGPRFFFKKKHECIKDDEHSMDEDKKGCPIGKSPG